MMRTVALLGGAALLMLAGCNQGPSVVPVSGTLMHNGKPMPGLHVTFEPVEGRPSFGRADENGRFTLRYTRDQDGARVGKHTVTVMWKPASAAEEFAGARPSEEVMEILRVYGRPDTTPFTEIEIKEATEDLVLNLD